MHFFFCIILGILVVCQEEECRINLKNNTETIWNHGKIIRSRGKVEWKHSYVYVRTRTYLTINTWRGINVFPNKIFYSKIDCWLFFYFSPPKKNCPALVTRDSWHSTHSTLDSSRPSISSSSTTSADWWSGLGTATAGLIRQLEVRQAHSVV